MTAPGNLVAGRSAAERLSPAQQVALLTLETLDPVTAYSSNRNGLREIAHRSGDALCRLGLARRELRALRYSTVERFGITDAGRQVAGALRADLEAAE